MWACVPLLMVACTLLSSYGFIIVSYDPLLASFFSWALLMLPIFLFFPSGFFTEPPSFVRNKRHSCSSGEPRADQCCPVLFCSRCSGGGDPRQEPTVSQANELSEIRLRPLPPGQVIIMRAVSGGWGWGKPSVLQSAGSCESVHRGSAGCCGNWPALQASTKDDHSSGFMASSASLPLMYALMSQRRVFCLPECL